MRTADVPNTKELITAVLLKQNTIGKRGFFKPI